MSFSRRLTAGIPAVGVTVLAALALSGSPASAATDVAPAAARPAAVESPEPGGTRGADDYNGDTGAEQPATATPAAPATTDTTGGTRGNPGYGGESPTTAPPATTPPTAPPGTVQATPPAGVSSETASPGPAVTTQGAGVSSGSTLPVTGAPMAGTIALGGLLVAAGVSAVWYTRRRRA
ncbi:hypothetical protein AB0F72_00405 [Actinoplanes sp. NPDC023936]|uniref:hypothetical protein n=1 Tax=Actinoplanes sp. NPDC023936 TaxID=3154910 RepID=UPI0033C61508